MPDQNLEPLRFETYLRMIENAPGTRMFASLFVRRKDDGTVTDVLNDGEYSCAVFASSVLTLAGLIDRPVATVASLRRVLDERGWHRTDQSSRPGDVVVWEDRLESDGTPHSHIGFAVGDDEAVSTSAKERRVVRHHLTSGAKEDGTPVRDVIAVYRPAW